MLKGINKRINSGNFSGGVTPVPIPNTEVKPTEVDGTIVTRLWESRTLPVYIKCPAPYGVGHFYLFNFCISSVDETILIIFRT